MPWAVSVIDSAHRGFPNTVGRYKCITSNSDAWQGEHPKELEEIVYTDPLELYCDDNPEADECR